MEDCIGKETIINFGGDIRMSHPWRGYTDDEIFTIVKKTKAGLYLLRDSHGKEYSLKKSNINYFSVGKIISSKIVEKDLSDVVSTSWEQMTDEQKVEELIKVHKYETDNTKLEYWLNYFNLKK